MTGVEGKAAVIDRPVKDVWKFMLDISNMPRWEDSGAVWEQTSEGPIGVGTTFRSSIHVLGRNVRVNLRITAFEPNRTFTAVASDGFGRGTTIRYLLEPTEGGKTRLSRVMEVRLHGLARLLRPFVAFIARRAGSIEATNVKRLVESQPR